MSTNPQLYFRTLAKDLLRLAKSEDPRACEEVRKIYVRFAETSDSDLAKAFGLMQAQHVVARRHGFAKWKELLAASPEAVSRAVDTVSSSSEASHEPIADDLKGPVVFENPIFKEIEQANHLVFENPIFKEIERANHLVFETAATLAVADMRMLVADKALAVADMRMLVADKALAVADMRMLVTDKAITVDTRPFVVDQKAFAVGAMPIGVNQRDLAISVDERDLALDAVSVAELLEPIEHVKVPAWVNETIEMAERVNPVPKFMRDEMEMLERMNPVPKALRRQMEMIDRLRADAVPDAADDE